MTPEQQQKIDVITKMYEHTTCLTEAEKRLHIKVAINLILRPKTEVVDAISEGSHKLGHMTNAGYRYDEYRQR